MPRNVSKQREPLAGMVVVVGCAAIRSLLWRIFLTQNKGKKNNRMLYLTFLKFLFVNNFFSTKNIPTKGNLAHLIGVR